MNILRILTIFLLVIVVSETAEYIDFIELPDGSLIEGIITEEVPSVSLIIETDNGTSTNIDFSTIVRYGRKTTFPESAAKFYNEKKHKKISRLRSYNTWRYLKTDHFIIAYTLQTAQFVENAAAIAENFNHSMLHYFGKRAVHRKIALVLYGDQDEANGFAYQYLPVAAVYCRAAPMLYRVNGDWLRTAITHELSHVFSFRLMSPLQPLGVSVNTGHYGSNYTAYGNTGLYLEKSIPAWFIEGIAQLGSSLYQADYLDPLREMLLRDAWKHGLLLDANAMARFEGTSREYELVYNQGFDLLLYLSRQVQPDTLQHMCRDISWYGFHISFNKHFGSLSSVYKKWKETLGNRFSQAYSGKSILPEPMVDRDPGRFLVETANARDDEFFIANWHHDYEIYNLYRIHPDSGRYKNIAVDIGRRLAYDEKNHCLYFSRTALDQASGTLLSDLYRIRAGRTIPERITRHERCTVFDARNGLLVYTAYEQGITIIKARRGEKTEILYTMSGGEPVYSLSIMRNGAVLCAIPKQGRITAWILENHILKELWKDAAGDILDITSFDQELVFCSTISGIPQLYRALPDSMSWIALTAVPGGALYPQINYHNGNLYYSLYNNGSLRRVRYDRQLPESNIEIGSNTAVMPKLKQAILYSPVYIANNVLLPTQPQIGIDVMTASTGSGSNFIRSAVWSPNMKWQIINPQQTFGLGIYSAIDLPLTNSSLNYHFTGTAECRQYAGGFTLLEFFNTELKKTHYEHWIFSSTFLSRDYTAGAGFNIPLSRNFSFDAGYSHQWYDLQINYKISNKEYSFFNGLFTWTEDYPKYFTADTITARLQSANGYSAVRLNRSLLAPQGVFADAGFTGYFIRLNANYYDQNDKYFSPRIDFNSYSGFITAKNKLSISYGNTVLAYQKNKIFRPCTYTTIDSLGLLNGYLYDTIFLTSLFYGYLELRGNPFVSMQPLAKWYERFSLGGKIEAGYVYDIENNPGLFLSTEFALRWQLCAIPAKPIFIWFKIAQAIEKKAPVQFLFGLTY